MSSRKGVQMKPREMVLRVLTCPLFVLACVFTSAQTLRPSPPIGAVVQTWTYDPTHNPPLVTAKIVNNSHKDITAFNISIKETYADGRIEKHETMEEFLGKIIAAKENQGNASPEAEYFRKVYGDG